MTENLQQQSLIDQAHACCAAGNPTKAVEICKTILQEKPNSVSALYLLGTIFAQAGHIAESEGLLIKAFDLKPGSPHIMVNLANVWAALGKTDQAIDLYDKAIATGAKGIGAYFNLGRLYKQMQKLSQAIEVFKKELEENPNNVFALEELCPLIYMSDFEKAHEYYERLYQLKPSIINKINLHTLLPVIMPEKTELEKIQKNYEKNLDMLLNEVVGVSKDEFSASYKNIFLSAFYLVYHGGNNKDLLVKSAQLFEKTCPDLLYTAPHCENHKPETGKKIKIGFVSSAFYKGVLSDCFNIVIKYIAKRDEFEVVMLSTDEPRRSDDVFQDLEEACEDCIHVSQNIFEAQAQISVLELDIIFYTDVFMDKLAYFISFARLAPVQCCGAGLLMTTGVGNMDYYFSAKESEPEDGQDYYSEKLLTPENLCVVMPEPEICNSFKTKSELGLSEDKNIYLCPMKLNKLHPDFDEVLNGIVEKDKDAEIIFFHDKQAEEWSKKLQERFNQNIKDSSGIKFLPWSSSEDFPSYLKNADVLLDTYYYGSGTTTALIFNIGTPMVTWKGDLFSCRLLYYYYYKIGVLDAVADGKNDYVDLAVKLATDKDAQEAVREKILANKDKLFAGADACGELADNFLEITKNIS